VPESQNLDDGFIGRDGVVEVVADSPEEDPAKIVDAWMRNRLACFG
jgi:hypothetical protein